ncbi:acidic leucine-rich nuclear phosphoprotein 32 family member A-like [Planococcus citri]|uniref:acidic leucine-rich nuclear phosphoprotein 32 family member A-like n=1 Tax=Planococcus citri TaxID=170843 RepID=UPI0031F8C534
MEKRIELEKRGRDAKEITELCLDNCRSPNIVGLTDEFVNLETLSLSNVGLTSLKGFPKLPNLKKLELSKNRISNGLSVLQSSPKLNYLNLSGNKIKDLESLEPLKECKNLKILEICSNEAASIENYREKLFNLIPQLKIVDGYNANQESDDSEVDEEEINGNGEEVSFDGEDDDDDDEDGDEEGADEEDDGDDGEEAEEEDEDDLGLESVYKENLDEESEGDDYDVEGDGEDDDDGVEEEEESENEGEDEKEESVVRGKKRKHDDEDEGE